jgi:cytochrome P450
MRYDPFDTALQADPYPTYEHLRRDDPLHRNEDRGFWALSRFADVWSAIHDPQTFSSAEGIFVGSADMDMTQIFLPMLIMMDPPRHTKLRAIVSRAFTPRRIAELEPAVRRLAAELLEAQDPEAPLDVVSAFAGPLPTFVIADLLGVPRSDYLDFRRWSDQLVSGDPFSQELAGASLAGAAALYEYFAAIIEERRQRPGDDLITSLVNAEVDGERLDHDELLGFCLLLLVAGNETTANLVGNAVVALTGHPDQAAVLADGTVGIDDAVEEFLRYDSPVQGLARTLTRPIELHDGTLDAGDKVMLLFGAANRDEAEFGASADRLDLTRRPPRHLAFGHGIHYCLGASLARLEAGIALSELLRSHPRPELAEPPARRRSGAVRGYERVLLTAAD